MQKALWTKKAVTIPACAALVAGAFTFAATPAFADPADLSITSQSVSGRVLTVNGTGTPGENVILQKGFPAERIPVGDDGTWQITYTIPGTDYDQHTYEIDQQNGLNSDGSVNVTAAAEAPVAAFAVTSQSVDGRVLTVNGTGNPDNKVQLLTGNGNEFVQRKNINADGTWTITYTIPGTDTDSHTYGIQTVTQDLRDQGTINVTAAAEATPVNTVFAITGQSVKGRTLTVSGTGDPADTVQIDAGFPVVRHDIADDGTWSFTYEIPGTDTDAHTYTILEEAANLSVVAQGTVTASAEAVTPASQFSLTSPTDGDTVDSRTVTFTGTGTPGDLVNVLAEDGTRAAPQTQVDADGNWSVVGTFSDSAAVTQNLSVNQFGGGQGQGNVTFTITLPAVAVTPGGPTTDPTTPADPADPTNPVTGGGTVSVPVGGGTAATPNLPVVSG
ncbi:hypothetical protein [Curtobacterium sp. Leaf261]|uniref:hypothetical protein n=1 Tax=Curtobacterium sp. Leaf261 TaxID=1736311 RepID=UPI0006FBF6B1|nr:hypothetical protein [Curtobacterium sp. Leaf261]KQO61438.1 hypothetical protein ASF23_13295 [Curtobacterium sp. Leaf261]